MTEPSVIIADVVERAARLVELELELGVAAGSLEPDELERIARGRRLLEYQRELALEQTRAR